MRTLVVVVGDPLVEVRLKRIECLVDLLSEGNSVELILHGTVQSFTDAIALWMADLGLTVIDVLELQIKLVLVVFRSSVELCTPIGQHP